MNARTNRKGQDTCTSHSIKSVAVPIRPVKTLYILEADRPTEANTAVVVLVNVGILCFG